MLARRKEKLPFYLRTLQQMEYTEKYPGFILNNFHSLLRFWQQHYLNKDKDSTCLENVCGPMTIARINYSSNNDLAEVELAMCPGPCSGQALCCSSCHGLH